MGRDVQRTLLWVILFGALFLLWDNYQVYQGKESFFAQPEVTQQANTEKTDVSVPAQPNGADAVVNVAQIESSKPVVVTTDCLKVTFDLSGAMITRTEMMRIPRQAKWTQVGLAGMVLGNKEPTDLGNVVLLEAEPGRIYIAQSGLVGGNFPNHKDEFKLISTDLNLDNKDKLDVVFEAVKGDVKVRKTFSFEKGHYAISVRTDVENLGVTTIKPSIYYQITRDGDKPADDNSMYSTYTGPAFYSSEDKFQKVPFADIADKSASFDKDADNGWVAMVQHHFVTAWLPKQGDRRENYARELDKNLFAVGSLVSLNEIAPGASASDEARIYSGPQSQKRLQELAPGLELVVDYGWLTFLAKPIYWLLSFLHSIIGNWGWSIVLLTCIVKAVLYPISAAGYRSMARMKEVTPRMKALQEKYKGDKERLNQAMMELYRTEKINPIGGCLPIILQIPVFLALYWVLQGSVELRGAPWILWVHDLALPDPWFILPLLMAITMFLQIVLNPKPTDPTQAKVMYIMPLVFSVMFFVFASGLVLYWLTNNVLSITQQWWINKTIAAERAKRMK